MSGEAAAYSQVIRFWNKAEGSAIGLFHVTCCFFNVTFHKAKPSKPNRAP
jgi:hypothetical protein